MFRENPLWFEVKVPHRHLVAEPNRGRETERRLLQLLRRAFFFQCAGFSFVRWIDNDGLIALRHDWSDTWCAVAECVIADVWVGGWKR